MKEKKQLPLHGINEHIQQIIIEMKPLNKQFAPKSIMPEKVIQFGEGNFLRAFVDWIIWKMDQKTDFNGSVVVVQPIEHGMVDILNGQMTFTTSTCRDVRTERLSIPLSALTSSAVP